MKLTDLVPDRQNRRLHNDRNLGMVVEALQTVGPARSIVIDEDNVILAGNGVTQAAAQAGITNVRVVDVAGDELVAVRRVGLTPAEKRALALYDNRTSELATWSVDQLKADALEGLDLRPFFTEQELSSLLDGVPRVAGRTDPDVVPPPRATDIQPGDLFALGPHRLLCGDSTTPEAYERVLVGETADLCLTDPPYGVGEAYASFEDSREHLAALVDIVVPLVRARSTVVLLTPGNKNQRLYPEPEWTLCWFVAAGTGRNPWGFTCWQPILAYGKDPYLAVGLGSRPDALAKTESADNTLGHPCPKPVSVWAWVMERGTVRAEALVLDPFCGSGTTLIAATQLRRRCAAIEIAPQYVQVAIDRWEAFTGQTATKVGAV